ncbi:unnamed protein product [Symbiodinium microadriaticum]|nr:unnamed protein product [Symbiodinium microadriaticum]
MKQAEDGAMKTPMLPRVQQVRGDQEDRYKEANNRLRKLLADERRSLQQVRHNYAQELKSRTEMEILLRACVEDVRKEIARRHIETAQLGSLMKGVEEGDIDRIYGNHASAIPVEAFDQEDRERVLELLLSQERVVTLVYSKTFPVHNGGGGKEGGGKSKSNATGPNALEDLLLNDDDAAEERPGTTGGLPSGLPGANPSTRPHTLPAPDDAGSNM